MLRYSIGTGLAMTTGMKNMKRILTAMKKGATIQMLAWRGYTLVMADGKKFTLKPGVTEDMVEAGLIQRIDDRSAAYAEEWGLSRCVCPTKCDCQNYPSHVSNFCPEHNEPYPEVDPLCKSPEGMHKNGGR